MKINLYGLRASGKSSVGQKISEEVGVPLIDLDQRITRELQADYSSNMTISRYVEQICSGNWQGFRDREHQSLRDLQGNNLLIALGGGTIAYDRNRHIIDPVDNYHLFGAHKDVEISKGVSERVFNRERYPKTSTRVFLDISLEEQRRRLEEDFKGKEHRPDLGQGLMGIYKDRIDTYRSFADITVQVDGKSIEDIVAEILGYSEVSEALRRQEDLF